MSEYVIDGLFLTQRITGTQRYAYEIVGELDKLVEKNRLQILVPAWADKLPEYKNIEVVKYGDHKGIPWQQIDLMRYLKKNKNQGIFLNNVFPLFYPYGIITIHDVCYKANPQFYCSLRDKFSMLWHRINYWCATRSDMKILTVSDFSKSEIIRYYSVNPERIHITYNGWQHLNRTAFANDTFERYNFLSPGNYYYSMSTLGANKNFRWILHAAKNNPDAVFAIAGGGKLKGAAEAEVIEAVKNPAIVHFTTSFLSLRPWVEGCKHPYAGEWLRYKAMSPWADVPMRKDNRSGKKKLAVKIFNALPRELAVGIAGILHARVVPMMRGRKR